MLKELSPFLKHRSQRILLFVFLCFAILPVFTETSQSQKDVRDFFELGTDSPSGPCLSTLEPENPPLGNKLSLVAVLEKRHHKRITSTRDAQDMRISQTIFEEARTKFAGLEKLYPKDSINGPKIEAVYSLNRNNIVAVALRFTRIHNLSGVHDTPLVYLYDSNGNPAGPEILDESGSRNGSINLNRNFGHERYVERSFPHGFPEKRLLSEPEQYTLKNVLEWLSQLRRETLTSELDADRLGLHPSVFTKAQEEYKGNKLIFGRSYLLNPPDIFVVFNQENEIFAVVLVTKLLNETTREEALVLVAVFDRGGNKQVPLFLKKGLPWS